MANGTIRIGTWNTWWRKPAGESGKIISKKLAATNRDILCVTEGFAEILPVGGHVIDAGADWGCPIKKGQRKVLLWSKRPWTPHTHALGSQESHKGRFVAGTTETASGACLTVIGVCIPWRDSDVSACKKDRKPWEHHLAWLEGFKKLRCMFPESRTVILGDFNQKIPRTWVPHKVFGALKQAFDGFEFATEGELPGDRRAIDHIAHTPDLTLAGGSIEIWPKSAKFADGSKLKLSDHFGVWGDFGPLLAG